MKKMKKTNKIEKSNVEDIIPLTPMQEGMLFHYLKDPQSEYYCEQLSLELSGEIDWHCFEKAWNFVIQTNEILRTVFRWEKVENPIQISLKSHKPEIKYLDKKSHDNGKLKKWFEEVKIKDRKNKFHLQDVPFRVTLCKIHEARYGIIISNHHILYDGWSNGIILKEFFHAYHTLRISKDFPGKELVKPVKNRFKEFVSWIKQRDIKEEEKFWRNYLGGIDTQVELAVKTGIKRMGAGTAGAKNLRISFAGNRKYKIEDFLKTRAITLASFLYSAWGILLQKYNNTDDVVFGTTVSGRSARVKGIENMVGLFINTLPVRIQTRTGETLQDLLLRIDHNLRLRESFEHSSLGDIKKYCKSDNKEEFFDSVVILENYPLDGRLIPAGSHLAVNSYLMTEMTHYDLTVTIKVFDDIEVNAVYRDDLFTDESILGLLDHFRSIVDNIIKNPGKFSTEIEIISKEEKRELLFDFNNTLAAYPEDKTIHRLFEEQVARTPDSAALFGPSVGVIHESPLHLTYRQLNEQSNQLAHLLHEKGVQSETIVAIMVERSIRMITGILGILKAGCAYLPIDPSYPEERGKYMLKDSSAGILLTSREIADSFGIWNLEFGISPSQGGQLAYVIYTSGSTGNPKGVGVRHRNAVNFITGMTAKIEFRAGKSILALTTMSFDIFFLETLLPLTAGMKVVIGNEAQQKDPKLLQEVVVKNRIHMLQVTPSRLNLLLMGNENTGKHLSAGALAGVTELMVGGEEFPDHLLKCLKNDFKFNGKIYNLYGPTETTIWSTLKDLTAAGEITIGSPISNTFIYILDRANRLQPIGVPGELCIGGVGVARGYLNNPELTARKFCLRRPGGRFLKKLPPWTPRKNFLLETCTDAMQPCSHSSTPSPHYPIYLTGDLARWLSKGEIEFIGRIDHQLKIRGFRIELGEIESCLTRHRDIKKAVVIVKENNHKEKQLRAYIVTGKNLTVSELKEYLSSQLPDYMIPAHFIRLEQIPLTPAGKVNRRALAGLGTVMETGVEYVSPGSEIEKKVAQIWLDVLGEAGRKYPGIHDNFFDIGGNSLSLIRVNSRLQEAFNRDIPMVALFNYPTIASLADYLGPKQDGREVSGTGPAPGNESPGNKNRSEELDVAVIGMSCRFPGAKNIDEFQANLKNGIESITFLTKEELKELGLNPQLIENPNFVPAKGRLRDFDYFDSFFFDYTPAEAAIMDPQVRIFHECCWEALENAGYDPGTYNGNIGLYAGASPNPFWEILPLRSIPGDSFSYSDQWEAIQFSDKDYLSTRIGYKLDLKGPCVTLQTACSTSLAAVSQAYQALLTGTCDTALAGGVSITLQDQAGYLYQDGTIMSPHGHCRAFDAGANGTVGGNGAGVVVLKSLAHALADRDHIYAVIKGIGINNDGRNKIGFTAPSARGQGKAIRKAHQMAGIEPETIGYIEAHGTATTLGDPIEIQGLKLAFIGKPHLHNEKNYCALGSVKANIGHLDAAAGIAGFIKTVLAITHRVIPPALHFESPNPAIDFENSPFYINTRPLIWKNDRYPLRGGVSSFGLGGTNVHVLLEEWPVDRGQKTDDRRQRTDERQYQLILLSAKTETALDKITQNLVEYFKKCLLNHGNHENPVNPGQILANAAYTLQVGRKDFQHRKMLVCSNDDIDGVIQALEPGEIETCFAKEEKPAVVFMFSGQGSQYVNMGLDLYETEPVFRHRVDHCFKILEDITGINMKPVLYPNKENIEEAKDKIHQFLYTTPIKFIFEYSLAKLLISWGIQPDAMIGHSFGEYVAACLSGVFSLEDGLFLAALRGRLMHGLPSGAMLSVPLSEQELKPLLKDEISLAAVNGHSLCVISGPVQAVEDFEKELNEKGHDCLRYQVPKAGHSRMVEPILAEFKEKIGAVKFNKPQIPCISSVTGSWLTPQQAVDPGYWTRHLRETVRFAHGLTTLFKELNPIFLQVGPGRGLTLFVNQHPDKKPGNPAVNMVRHVKENMSDVYYTLTKIGRLWLNGIPLDWKTFYANQERYRIPLPAYPFDASAICYKTPPDLFTLHVNRDGGRGADQVVLSKKNDIADWFYIPSWKRADVDVHLTTGAPEKQCYLIFKDDCHIASQLSQLLKEEGHDVISVSSQSRFKRLSDSRYEIDPHDSTGYMKLFKELEKNKKQCGKILHCWGITKNVFDQSQIEKVDRALDPVFFSLVFLAKALEESKNEKIQIDVITNHLQDVTGEEELCPLKSTVMGAVKVIQREYPHISCRGIDISGTLHEKEYREKVTRQLHRELIAGSKDSIMAYRGKHRWVQCYEAKRLEKTGEKISRLRKGGVYLITGGLGGIGLTLAEFLAKNYQAKLILTGRSGLPAKEKSKIAKIKELESLGARVLIKKADVSNFEQMKKVITGAKSRFGRINGVIHAAGVLNDGMIRLKTREDIIDILAPKVKGTLVLEAIFKDRGPDFFVLCSSISSLTGPFGQVAYCAANIFLDTFARQKFSQDREFTAAVNWNTWKEVGMAVDAVNQLKQNYNSRQNNVLLENEISPAKGVEVFTRVLRCNQPQLIVSAFEINHYIEQFDLTVNLLRQEVPEDIMQTGAVNQKRPDLSTPYVPPRNPIEKTLVEIWQKLFGIQPVGIHDDFFQLGGDSLKAVIVSSKIYQVLETKISLKDFFNHPSIEKLGRLISSSKKSLYFSIEPVEKKEYYPLSSAQHRMHVLYQLKKESIVYNVPSVTALQGQLDRQRLEETFRKLISRHESFRTAFPIIDGEPVQRIHRHVEFEMEYYDLITDIIRPFDLSRAPLLRAGLIETGEQEYMLILDMHHIISDGASVATLAKEFMALYEGKSLPPLKIQYKDFSGWQNHEKKKGTLKNQEEYWQKQLKGKIPLLAMPIDFPRPETHCFEGSTISFDINGKVKGELEKLTSDTGATLHIVLLTVFYILLFKYTEQEDIIVGSLIAGRTHPELENIIGMFVNMLIMRDHPGENKTFREFLPAVKENALKAYENQDYPFEAIVEKLDIQREPGRHPLIDAVFVFQDMEMPGLEIPGLKLTLQEFEHNIAHFDLSLTAFRDHNTIKLKLEYSTALFNPCTAERLLKQYIEILGQVTVNQDIKLKDISITHDLLSAASTILYDDRDFSF